MSKEQEQDDPEVTPVAYKGTITVKFKITGEDMPIEQAEKLMTQLMAGNNIGEHFFLRFPPGIGDLNINVELKKDSPIITLDKDEVVVVPEIVVP